MRWIVCLLVLALNLTVQAQPVISKYLSYREVTMSAGHSYIPNKPDARQLKLYQKFGVEFFDKLRVLANSPLYVSSCYRSVKLNAAVGGAKNSDHMALGDVVAIDIDQDGRGSKIENRALFFLIKDNMSYQKLLWEFDEYKIGKDGKPSKHVTPKWVHVSWSSDPAKNVKKAFRAVKRGNKTVYTLFSTY